MELGPLQTKWIETLEKHPERQMTGFLGRKDSQNNFKCCCLGQGGLIAGVCEWVEHKGEIILMVSSLAEMFKEGGGDYAQVVEELSGNYYKALGLRGPSGNVTNYKKKSLAFLNDSGTSWVDIAKLLRENPESYFTHSV